MSTPMLCHGCGHAWQVPEDFSRKKAQCPECGIFCEVPEAADWRTAPAGAHKSAATVESLHDDREPKTVTMTANGVGDCPHCGEKVRFSPGRKGRSRTCPLCDGPVIDDSVQQRATAPDAKPFVVKPVTSRFADVNKASPLAQEPPLQLADSAVTKPFHSKAKPDEGSLFGDDSYGLVGGEQRHCPNCSMMVEEDAVRCPRCWCNMMTGEMPVKTYEPMEREWESGMSFQKRLTIFLIAEGVFLTFGLISAFLADELLLFFLTWQFFTVMLAFVIGTYNHLFLKRNERGKVTLTEMWRVCLIPRPKRSIRLTEYEGVLIHNERDAGFWDWLVFAFLFPMGVLPALFWFYYFIHQDKFVVSLCKEHGFPDKVIFRGMSETTAKDIAATIQEAVGFPSPYAEQPT